MLFFSFIEKEHWSASIPRSLIGQNHVLFQVVKTTELRAFSLDEKSFKRCQQVTARPIKTPLSCCPRDRGISVYDFLILTFQSVL